MIYDSKEIIGTCLQNYDSAAFSLGHCPAPEITDCKSLLDVILVAAIMAMNAGYKADKVYNPMFPISASPQSFLSLTVGFEPERLTQGRT